MSSIAPSLRHQYPESDFLDPAYKTGLILDQQDVDQAAAILQRFRDPAAAAARLRLIAARKDLRLPPALAAAAFAAPKYSQAELDKLLPADFADVMNRQWPVLDQQDLDSCLRGCPQAREAGHPIHAQVLKLAARRQLTLPDDFQRAVHAANFAYTTAARAAWDQEAAAGAVAFAAGHNSRRRKAALPPEPQAPQLPASGIAEFGSLDAEAVALRQRATEFAQAQNRRRSRVGA
jgi:hypothetical protein